MYSILTSLVFTLFEKDPPPEKDFKLERAKKVKPPTPPSLSSSPSVKPVKQPKKKKVESSTSELSSLSEDYYSELDAEKYDVSEYEAESSGYEDSYDVKVKSPKKQDSMDDFVVDDDNDEYYVIENNDGDYEDSGNKSKK